MFNFTPHQKLVLYLTAAFAVLDIVHVCFLKMICHHPMTLLEQSIVETIVVTSVVVKIAVAGAVAGDILKCNYYETLIAAAEPRTVPVLAGRPHYYGPAGPRRVALASLADEVVVGD